MGWEGIGGWVWGGRGRRWDGKGLVGGFAVGGALGLDGVRMFRDWWVGLGVGGALGLDGVRMFRDWWVGLGWAGSGTSVSIAGYFLPLLFPRHLVLPPSSSWHQKPFCGSNLEEETIAGSGGGAETHFLSCMFDKS